MLKTKICKNCSVNQSLSCFSNDKNSKDGLKYYCKSCRSKWGKVYYKANTEKLALISKKYAENNKDKIKKKWKSYYYKNKEKLCEASREYYYKNKDQRNELHSKWMKNNKAKVNEYQNNRRKNNVSLRINHSVATGILKSLKENKNGRSWERLVGYTINKLKKHIEKQFIEGMSWDNYGSWHIDHEIPISAFNFTTTEHIDFKRCWSIKNLRPMWAKDNLEKGVKLEKHFQPSLPI